MFTLILIFFPFFSIYHPPSGRVLEVLSDQPSLQWYTSRNLPDPDAILVPSQESTEQHQNISSHTPITSDQKFEEFPTPLQDTKKSSAILLQEPSELPSSQKLLQTVPTSPQSVAEIKGKDGTLYKKYGGFCLETQNYPDAVNHVSNCMNGVFVFVRE